MKKLVSLLVVCFASTIIISCSKDEGKSPNISFKTGGIYTSTDATLAADSDVVIGVNASKAEDKDVLKQFNVSKSVNGATAVTVFEKSLTGTEGDNYSYDLVTMVGTTVGEKDKYTFTVTNRDGIINQISLTLTAQ